MAGVVFTAFVLVFLNIGGVFASSLSFLPKIQFWPAVMAANIGLLVLFVALAMICGRVYCSFLCPLGILQDLLYRLRITGAKKRRYMQGWTEPENALRYGILAAFLAVICIGYGSFAFLIEPYSLFGMMVTSFLGRGVTVAVVSAVFFAVIAFMVFKWGRAWCNTVCPVGAILSILSRRSLMRPVIDKDKCVGCGLCGKACRANCIDTKNHMVDTSRCVMCFDCIDNCREGAIKYGFSMGNRIRPTDGTQPQDNVLPKDNTQQKDNFQPKDSASEMGMPRRAFLGAFAIAAGAVAMKAAGVPSVGEGRPSSGAGNHHRGGGTVRHGELAPLVPKQVPQRSVPVVPPGARTLKNYDAKCLGCSLCVSACPNHVLRVTGEPGSMFLQPVMGFEKGFCRPECTVCSQVCPAGAIEKITKEEKASTSIGHAVYVSDMCVITTDGVSCGNCVRHCPYGALAMEDGYPVVDEDLCTGCGRCEYVCPVRPLSAIHVEGNEIHRNLNG